MKVTVLSDDTSRSFTAMRAAVGARDIPIGTRTKMKSWRTPKQLLILFATIWLFLAVAPVNRLDWLMENLLIGITVPWLIVTRERMRFSNQAYMCIFVFLVMHAVGAHFTYSLVPYDRWFQALAGTGLNQLLGLQRNHYDRLVHFLYGALLLLPSVELFDRYAPPLGVWRWLMPVMFVTSHGVIYELLEWLTALIVAPSLGEAYLGTQGDVWDAQPDMALASAGAVLAMMLLAVIRRCTRQKEPPCPC
jgi:putative membrane protein